MKVVQNKIGNTSRLKFLRAFILLFAFSTLIHFQSFAQDSAAVVPDSASTGASVSDDGPSLKNLSKNLKDSAEELERIRHEEIMSYVYMGLGFSVVIGIAWFTTVLARKRKKKEDEVRAMRAANAKHHHKPHHHKR